MNYTNAVPGVVLLGILLLPGGCGRGGEQSKAGAGAPSPPGQPAAREATPVRIAPAIRTIVRRTIPVTGSISALQSIDLSPKIAAKVVSVAGREGTPVRRGQIVVQQDASDLITQVQQAEANVNAARARVSQAETQARVAASNSRGEVENMRQQLRQAEAALALARRPQRTQEVAVAENAVAQAQANYDRAQVDRQRYERLVKEGAAAQSVLDQYVTAERVARASLDSAKQQLDIARTGGREENIRTAEANVARARLGVGQARTNLQQNAARQEDIKAARAALAQAQAALAFARQQVANASIRSPINGVIADRLTEPGQQAAPGLPVLRLVALSTVFFEAQVPETAIRSIRPGLTAPIRVDAYPGRAFMGQVAKVYPTASAQSRNFTVRIILPNAGSLLRPGMFARGEIVAESREGIVVPKDALLAREGKSQIFVAKGKKAVLRDVRIGVVTPQTVEIRAGVQAGEQVVVAGQEALSDGGAINVRGQDGAERAASAP